MNRKTTDYELMIQTIEREPLNKIAAVRFDEATYQQLLALAPARGLGQTIRSVVRQHLAANKEVFTEDQKKNSVAV